MSQTEVREQRERKPVVNFSRPRFNTAGSSSSSSSSKTSTKAQASDGSGTTSSRSDSNESVVTVRAVNAFHDPRSSLPSEPRFSTEEEDPSTQKKLPIDREKKKEREIDASPEFAWDERRGELVDRIVGPSMRVPAEQRNPFSAAAAARRKDSHDSDTTTTTSSSSSPSPSSSSSSSCSTSDRKSSLSSTPQPPARPLKSILKRTSLSQHSSYRSSSSSAGESITSHHTISESGDGFPGQERRDWTSSDHDTSMLSEKEREKLEKKGVNPALYAEMKAARKGKSCIGGLTGNAYVS